MGAMTKSHPDNTIDVDDNSHKVYSINPVHLPEIEN